MSVLSNTKRTLMISMFVLIATAWLAVPASAEDTAPAVPAPKADTAPSAEQKAQLTSAPSNFALAPQQSISQISPVGPNPLEMSRKLTVTVSVDGKAWLMDAATGQLMCPIDPETNECIRTACYDGIDNDGDGLRDLNDPGCESMWDNDEYNPPPPPDDPPPQPAQPVVTEFRSDYQEVDYNTGIRLTWNSIYATWCEAYGGSLGWAGSRGVWGSWPSGGLTASTTFYIRCHGAGGSSEWSSVPVTVRQPAVPTLALDASPKTLTAGGTTTLTWSSTNATSCPPSDGSPGWTSQVLTSGSWTTPALSAGSYTYKRICTGPGGSSETKSVTVTVNPPTTPVPAVTLNPNPTSLIAGGTTTLTWSSTNATSCTASGGSTGWAGSKTTGGSWTTPALSAGSYTYSIYCSGAGGTSPLVSKAVTVNAPPVPSNGCDEYDAERNITYRCTPDGSFYTPDGIDANSLTALSGGGCDPYHDNLCTSGYGWYSSYGSIPPPAKYKSSENYCSAPWWAWNPYRGGWNHPCYRHDVCYGSQLGRAFCDVWLHRDLQWNCRNRFGKWDPRRYDCLFYGGEWYLAVKIAGGSHYKPRRSSREP